MTLSSASWVLGDLLSPAQITSGASALPYFGQCLVGLEILTENLVASERLHMQVSTNNLFLILPEPALPLFHVGFSVLKAEEWIR